VAVTTNRGRSDTTVDPATHITDVPNVEIVFNDGVGYETRKLLGPVNGYYGEY
jgi:hypothetical protein